MIKWIDPSRESNPILLFKKIGVITNIPPKFPMHFTNTTRLSLSFNFNHHVIQHFKSSDAQWRALSSTLQGVATASIVQIIMTSAKAILIFFWDATRLFFFLELNNAILFFSGTPS